MIEPHLRRLAHQPNSQKIGGDGERQQRKRGCEIARRELAEREIRQNLHPVHEGEKDHAGADQRQLVESLRQDVDLKRRRADLNQKRHEAGHRAPQYAEHNRRAARFVGDLPQLGQEPRTEPSVERKRKPDRADSHLDAGIGDRTCKYGRRAGAEDGARHQHFQIPRAPSAPIGPDRDDVLAHQDRQQDGRGLQRRHGERQQRRRDHADADEAALAEAERGHGGDRQEIEQRVSDHWRIK